MSQIHKHDIPANIADRCLITPEQYHENYQQSITAPDTFWGEQGHILDWIKPYQKVKNTSFAPGNVSIKWYEDGTLNLAANCLDRHLAERGNETAIIWEGDDASQSKHITYKELHRGGRGGLRAYRRNSLGDFWRVLARGGCGPYCRFQFKTGDHRR